MERLNRILDSIFGKDHVEAKLEVSLTVVSEIGPEAKVIYEQPSDSNDEDGDEGDLEDRYLLQQAFYFHRVPYNIYYFPNHHQRLNRRRRCNNRICKKQM